jgi:hypothetical protein
MLDWPDKQTYDSFFGGCMRPSCLFLLPVVLLAALICYCQAAEPIPLPGDIRFPVMEHTLKKWNAFSYRGKA